jgi:hypothetical protein
MACADALEVRGELEAQWDRDEEGAAAKNARRAQQTSLKAWRFAGEMEEIAATMAEAGLPAGFHLAAADLYRRMARFKDAAGLPPLEAVLDSLLASSNDAG